MKCQYCGNHPGPVCDSLRCNERALRDDLEAELDEELGEPCENCGMRGEHEEKCLQCSGTCSRRYWDGDFGCPSHAAYNYAEEMADRAGGRI